MADVLDAVADILTNLRGSDLLKKAVDRALENDVPVSDVLEKGLRKGLREVGNRYEGGEYFLSELLFAASMMSDAMTALSPRLTVQTIQGRGSIVLGTVRADIHDIGKNIFKMLAEGTGFTVHDLGVDVEPQRFVEIVRNEKADILGLSALLTTSTPEMGTVIQQLEQAHIRKQVRVLLGGNAVTEQFGKEISADGSAYDAVHGVRFCEEWTG